MVTKALDIQALGKSFGEVDVLRHIDVSMEEGDFLVLVGPSGCGKSTLLNCIAGLEDVTSGKIFIAGRDVTGVPPKDRDIAMVFQSYALYPTMSVGENIGFGMKIRHMDPAEISRKTRQVAELLQIDQLLDRRPSQLSGGQRQRVAMGRALVREPALFLFDEPLSNLDAKLRVELRAEIKRLHKSTGTSMVYVTHDQIEAMTLATRIVVLKDGVVQQVGTPDEIYHTPNNTFVADFMGSPPMNLIPATVDGAAKTIDFGNGQTLKVPDMAGNVATHGDVLVGIRPEDFEMGDAIGGASIRVKPTMVENTGSDSYLSFMLGGAPATARLSGRADLAAAELELGVHPGRICYFERENGLRL